MECKKCGCEHDGSFGSGIYCSRSCSNSRSVSDAHRKKTSDSMKGRKVVRTEEQKTKWRQTMELYWEEARKEKMSSIFTKSFQDLRQSEHRIRILYDQNGMCDMCGIPQEWNGQPLKFELDHINGNRDDNSRNNLRMVCPNCHSQTPTYKGKNSTGNNKVSDEQFIVALNEQPSIYKALVALGMSLHGGNYTRARKIIKKYNLEIKM